MKFIFEICIHFTLILSSHGASRVKITNVGCNTSGISVIHPYSRIKAKSISSLAWSLGFEVIRPIPKFQVIFLLCNHSCDSIDSPFSFIKVDFQLSTKPSTNWRTFIDLKKIELCDALVGKHPVGILNGYITMIRQLFPGLVPKDCPIKIGKYFCNNTLINYNTNYEFFRETFTSSLWPNGVYRLFVRLRDDQDVHGVAFWQVFEYYKWFNNGTSY